MDTRFNYHGNPVAAKFVKHVVSASKVVTGSTLPTTTQEVSRRSGEDSCDQGKPGTP